MLAARLGRFLCFDWFVRLQKRLHQPRHSFVDRMLRIEGSVFAARRVYAP